MLEPLVVAIHAVNRVEEDTIGSTKSCLIFGAGAIGLLCAVAARARGCQRVAMVDIDEGRLAFALEHGFASIVHAVKPKRGETLEERLSIAKETTATIGSLTWPDGEAVAKVQFMYECTGAESCLQGSIYVSLTADTCYPLHSNRYFRRLYLGEVSFWLEWESLTTRFQYPRRRQEINMIATWRYAGAYAGAIAVAQASVSGNPFNEITLPNISKLITHRFEGLDSVEEAFDAAGKTRDEKGNLIVKAVIDF